MAHQINATKATFKENSIKRGSKVDIKEIRKRFEEPCIGTVSTKKSYNSTLNSNQIAKNNLQVNDNVSKKFLKLKAIEQTENNHSNSCDPYIASSHKEILPKVPMRRNRKNLLTGKEEVTRLSKYNDLPSDVNYNVLSKPGNRVTVQDMTQLFEVQPTPSELHSRISSFNMNSEKTVPQVILKPPIKPPRTPTKKNNSSSSDNSTENVPNDDSLKKLVDLNRNLNSNIDERLLSTKHTQSSGNSLNLKRVPALKLGPRLSVPEIYTNDMKLNPPEFQNNNNIFTSSKAKISVYSNKTKTFKDYFKNLSTVAQNIHEMVKGKQSDIFNTSKTSSSRKYGTLKKSFSDEHIYAEPFANLPMVNHSRKDCSSDALHYMCTPIINRRFDKDVPTVGNKSTVLNQTQPSGNLKNATPSSGNLKNTTTPLPANLKSTTPSPGNLKNTTPSPGNLKNTTPSPGNLKNTTSSSGNLKNNTSSTGNLKNNKASVRRIIYESFSALRKIPEDDENVKSNQSGDSESDVSIKDVEERITYVKSIKKQVSLTSSICIKPKLFDAVLIITISENGPEVLFKQSKAQAPFDYPLIQHLCFPDYKTLHKKDIYASEWFCFTLIHGEEEKFYGYCHRILGWSEEKRGFCRRLPVAICIISSISAPLFYKKILDEIEKHLTLPNAKCIEYLAALQKLGVPNAGASLCIPEDKKETIILRPFDSHTVGVELTRSLQLLDVDVLLKIVASLLLERRVLLLSSKTGDLLHCVTAVTSLLYPFQWQHLLMPIVPACLAVQCCIESPYLLGIISTQQSDIIDLLGEHQVFVVNIDKGTILKSFGDEDTILPKKVQKAVICALNLAKNMTDPTELMRDIMISEAIVHMFVEILGHCNNHFTPKNGSYIFQKEAFQKSCSSRSIHSFLKWFSETQMFEAFIEECIWRKAYRSICQSQVTTFFEKRIDEYNWELTYNNEKITKKIVKRVQDLGEMLKGFKRS